MTWKRFLKSKISKTTIWMILCLIIIGGLAFIFVDETCTFHIQRIMTRPTPFPTAAQTPLTPDKDDMSDHV